mgnify:CR=1 FL=1
MKKAPETKAAEKIAREVFGFDLEYRGCDGYDFFDSDRGCISVGSLQEALERAYRAGAESVKGRACK